MGKRKQKIRWCQVDWVHGISKGQADADISSVGVVKGAATRSESGRTRRLPRSPAPRFLRKAAAEEEEFCEAEDLPNGFTKIRNVNRVNLISFQNNFIVCKVFFFALEQP